MLFVNFLHQGIFKFKTPVAMSGELKPILAYFYQWEKSKANEICLKQPYGKEWKSLTWKEAGIEVRKIASALKSKGLKKGDHIGIFSKNCYHWILADLAIMMCECVSIPFYPNINSKQLDDLISKSDVKALFVGKLDNWEKANNKLAEKVEVVSFPHYPNNAVVEIGENWNDLLQEHEPLAGEPVADLNDLWTILFTSGTTGSPKGVMLDQKSISMLLQNEIDTNDLKLFSGKDHRYFSFLPLNHIAERVVVEGAFLLSGGSISFAESLDTFAQNLQDVQPTLFLAVPRIWSKFHQAIVEKMPPKRLNTLLKLPIISGFIKNKIKKALGLSKARIIFTGAAPTPVELKKWYKKLGITLQEVYGMTETCGGCTFMPIDKDLLKPGTVGRPAQGVKLKLDPESNEISVFIPWGMKGYYKDPELTANVLKDGWIRTGDQGSIDKDGFLKITGRVSDTFKTAKGKFVVPNPIELQFSKNDNIDQICLVGLSLPQPIALITLSENGTKKEGDQIIQNLKTNLKGINESLSKHEKISTIVVLKEAWTVENGILTPTLKVKRPAVNETFQDRLSEWHECDDEVVWE